MTEIDSQIETEVETVTVTLEDLKSNLEHYYWLKQTKRLVVTYNEEKIAVVGRWLPDERGRTWSLHWPDLLNEMYPDPVEPGEPELLSRALQETRGSRPFSTSMLQPSPSWSETRTRPRRSGNT
jgi:hypothetical protein